MTPLIPARHAGEQRRHGFTLLELLIVILIIAVLASMLAGAAMKVLILARVTQATVEMDQMAAALADFNSRFGAFPPSNLTLGPLGGIPIASRQFLLKCWPRMNATVNWPVSGQLTGDQVLVWALGGMQDGNGSFVGFSDNPRDPTTAGGTRIGPFYEFRPEGLKMMAGRTGYPSYTDSHGWDMPYFYFAARQPPAAPGTYGPDCPGVTNNQGVSSGTQPYQDTATHWYQSSSFQLICAGHDGIFGAGGLWRAQTADVTYPSGSPGSDDQTNFYPAKMGMPTP